MSLIRSAVFYTEASKKLTLPPTNWPAIGKAAVIMKRRYVISLVTLHLGYHPICLGTYQVDSTDGLQPTDPTFSLCNPLGMLNSSKNDSI